ncbi:MAG: hypothetical protein AAGH46_11580 [Bacteroidota bacterium]
MKQTLITYIFLIPVLMFAQIESETENEDHIKHRLSLGLGHTHIPEDNGDKVLYASWALDYDYHFNETWGIGLETDIIMESFVIERPNGEELERKYPFSLTPVALFKPIEHWTFIGGIGAEFAPGETLAFTRLGVEYGVEISKKWELGASVLWDARWDYFNSWGLAIMISRVW